MRIPGFRRRRIPLEEQLAVALALGSVAQRPDERTEPITFDYELSSMMDSDRPRASRHRK